MADPYSGYPRPGEAPARRPSYANVAAGSSSNVRLPNPSFSTLAGARGAGYGGLRPQLGRRQSSHRSMEEDWEPSRPSSGGGARRRWSGEVLRFDDGLGCAVHEQHAPFFTPSYLRQSRHVQRLRREYERHLVELRERAEVVEPGVHTAGVGQMGKQGLSRSSSSVNVGKMQAGYGGQRSAVAQDVIERVPPMHHRHYEDDGTHPLPSRWNEDDKIAGLEILGDGTEVRFTGVTKSETEAASIRTDYPIPRECGLYYFEVTLMSRTKDATVAVGLSGRRVNLQRLPGWEQDSWAYHGDDGLAFTSSSHGKNYGPPFAVQDVVGCGISLKTGSVFFTKNGVFLGNAFNNIKFDTLYPTIGVKKPQEHVQANFGRSPFVFDIDGMMAEERKAARAELNSADVSALHPPDDESTLIHKLIGQYLQHEGYVETSKAFASDIRDRAAAAGHRDDMASLSGMMEGDDDVHAIQRQRIRRAILEGDIDRALKYTQSYYPQVLQDERNKDVYFRLRCRKFVEMMRRYSELRAAGEARRSAAGNDGEEDDEDEDEEDEDEDEDEEEEEEGDDRPDTQMELDSQLQPPTHSTNDDGDIDMTTSTSSLPPSKPMKATDHLTAALAYGQELQAEFGSDARPAVKKELADVFAIMAYANPAESVLGGVLDVEGRKGIAEGVNGAILVSLGKPSSAALERVCVQTEALLDAVAAKTGGLAGFVNVREDILKG